ncbi:MAG TPA: helix-turn-helix transcriptional regulator [Bryobacteraceae bacterium]|nr:helix-turn-helix transcriptional regulator [Bryobacteraceae bacterium]
MAEHQPLSAQAFHILVALAGGDQHGYGIMQDVAARTGGKMQLSAGTLYGAIQRLLEQGYIVEQPGSDDRRRVYRLTALGRKAARAEATRLAELLEQARQYGLAPERG